MSHYRPKELSARHLNGEAAIYTRQSSKKQDKENRGSLEYQRGQARYAREWGFPEDKIRFYEDRGLSGCAKEHRPEFLKIDAGIEAGRITVVFASDQSRLARNAVEWFEFLALCHTHDVLVVLDGRIINLGDGGDGFSSKIAAIVDEYDLEKRRGHILRGIKGRLGDKKAVSNPPTGYISLKEAQKGEWIFDPDPEVQKTIPAVFFIFLEERSCARAVRRMLAEGMKVPCQMPGRELMWTAPTIGSVRRILTNPSYCGDYCYRRRIGDPKKGRDKYGHFRVRVGRPDEHIVIREHHPAYVTREVFEEVQHILHMNAPMKNRRNLCPGSALLQGIISCGEHDRSMSVDYKEPLADGRNGAHFYHCGGTYETGGKPHRALPGRQLELAVTLAVFARLTRPSVETVRDAWEDFHRSDPEGRLARAATVTRAQRLVDDLRARNALVNPALRDLAEDLEVRLNDALRDLKLAKVAAETPVEDSLFTEAAFEELLLLCEDLPTLFRAATTTHRDRKEILRTMVERVIVTGRTPETIFAVIRWADGSEPTEVEAHLAKYAHRLIRQLAERGFGNAEIAKRMNEMGITTNRERLWTAETVWVARFKNQRLQKAIAKAS